jgi:K+-transporting ATPase ATPase A chain
MNAAGWAEIALTIGLTVALAWPLGAYLARVWQGQRTWLDPVMRPVERVLYAAAGVKSERSQPWYGYAASFLAFSAASFVLLYLILLYLILRFQDLLPLNPQGFGGLSPHLAFNTAVSFVTNTNWQSYVPEQTVSTFSQMAGLTSQNFLSGACGMALAAVMARAFVADREAGLGHFWVDLTRITLYVLLPFSLVIALAYVGLGLPQSLLASVQATTVEGAQQTIALYPAASQEAIKQLGTNGGGRTSRMSSICGFSSVSCGRRSSPTRPPRR